MTARRANVLRCGGPYRVPKLHDLIPTHRADQPLNVGSFPIAGSVANPRRPSISASGIPHHSRRRAKVRHAARSRPSHAGGGESSCKYSCSAPEHLVVRPSLISVDGTNRRRPSASVTPADSVRARCGRGARRCPFALAPASTAIRCGPPADGPAQCHFPNSSFTRHRFSISSPHSIGTQRV
jgi:hypothetical protein